MSNHFSFSEPVLARSLETIGQSGRDEATYLRRPLSSLSGLAVDNDQASRRTSSSRRRKLWEVPHKHHCPIIGVCFEVDELRRLTEKTLKCGKETTDYALHTFTVTSCQERNVLSEQLNRTLDRRFALMIKRFSSSKDSSGLRVVWREACQKGTEIPAALWAATTHPGCDDDLEQEIYRDIHMIQHQVGSGARVELKAMNALREENVRLQQQLDHLREKHDGWQRHQARSMQAGQQRVIELQSDLARRDALIQGLQAEVQTLRGEAAALPERQSLLLRLQVAEEKNRMLADKEKETEKELARLRDFARYAEETIEALSAEERSAEHLNSACQEDVLERNLLGKSVLCVGGRPGSVNSYREVVEQCGGRFLHHDGGLEESKHRIDAALSAADIVICQAGCISHNAYWRVKEQCKRTGKLCMFVKGSGLGSFGKVVNEAGKKSAMP